ncbi:MAG: RNA pseudouridine synthase, partial [Clostridia bacterium]|nr:RNA pseudouridine synthase [Clostridia bacterium]
RLLYEVLETVELDNGKISLIKIELITGRSHQIRVQFSHRKMPLLGDKKYGSQFTCPIALFSYAITLNLPSGEQKRVTALPERSAFPWNEFKNY